jgi:hypothetical protein
MFKARISSVWMDTKSININIIHHPLHRHHIINYFLSVSSEKPIVDITHRRFPVLHVICVLLLCEFYHGLTLQLTTHCFKNIHENRHCTGFSDIIYHPAFIKKKWQLDSASVLR